MDNNSIITLPCPKCGALLEATSDTVLVRCKYCKQEMNISDLDISSKVNSSNRIESYINMANNAVANDDFSNAEIYFRLVCEANSSKENIARYNICSFLGNQINFTNSMIEDIDVLPNDEEVILLKKMYDKSVSSMENDIATATEFCITSESRNQKKNEIISKYRHAITTISESLANKDSSFTPIVLPSSTKKSTSKKISGKIIKAVIAIIVLFIILYIVLKLVE